MIELKKDELGNTLSVEASEIFLFLARIREKRSLGVVARDHWWVQRLPSWQAKGEGHWLHTLQCWGLNYHTLKFAKVFGFSRVHFAGYDGEDVYHTFIRDVEECLRSDKIKFSDQGFELQVCLRPVSRQGRLW